MRYAEVENGVIVNLIEADDEYVRTTNRKLFLDLPENPYRIGDKVDDLGNVTEKYERPRADAE